MPMERILSIARIFPKVLLESRSSERRHDIGFCRRHLRIQRPGGHDGHWHRVRGILAPARGERGIGDVDEEVVLVAAHHGTQKVALPHRTPARVHGQSP